MNTKAIVTAALAVAVVGAGAATAFADKPEDTGPPKMVTICHAAGLADEPANWITLTLPEVAVYGQAGHFYENGTPRAGHEQDYLGECDVDDTTTTTVVEETTTTTVEETTTTVAEETTTTVADETTTTAAPAIETSAPAPAATPAPPAPDAGGYARTAGT